MRLKKAIHLAILVGIVGALIVGGCTSSSSSNAPKELKIATRSFEEDTVIPWKARQGVGRDTLANMYDSLISLGSDGKAAPGLATKWEMSPDGSSWTFNLRQGVKFHDGSDLTTDDVQFSWDKYWANDKVTTDYATIKRYVTKYEMVDKYTIKVYTKMNNVALPDLMIDNSMFMMIMPKAYFEKNGEEYFAQHPIGSGPWVFVDHKAANYFKFKKAPSEQFKNSYRPEPKFDLLTILEVPDDNARVSMLKTGEVDVATLSVKQAGDVKGDANLNALTASMIQLSYRIIDASGAEERKMPTGNAKVREAMALAVDKQSIVKDFTAGYGQVSLGMEPAFPFYGEAIVKAAGQAMPYDPAKAKQLLAEAGYPQGFEVTLYAFPMPGAPFAPDLAQIVAGYWEAIGIKTKLEIGDSASMRPLYAKPTPDKARGQVYMWRNPPWMYPPAQWDSYWSKGGVYELWSSPKTDELFKAAYQETDPKKRDQLMAEIAATVSKLNISVPLLYVPDLMVKGPKVKDFTTLVGKYGMSDQIVKMEPAK